LWGFLKYYHPTVGGGAINWDSVLVSASYEVMNPLNKTEYNEILNSIIPNIYYTKTINEDKNHQNSIFYLNANTNFIFDTLIYSEEIIEKCRKILFNKYLYDNIYVQAYPYAMNPNLESDTAYTLPVLPSLGVRMLSLFRYWNIINYFYPYKYLNDKNWNDVLIEYIPKFINADDTLKYHLVVCQLITNVNDNHVFATSNIIKKHLGEYRLPVYFKTIENQHIVYKYVSDSLGGECNLKLGDIILSVNGVKINDIKDSLKFIISGSNRKTIIDKVNIYLRKSREDVVNIQINRQGFIINLQTKAYKESVIQKIIRTQKKQYYTKIVSNDLHYLNLAKIKYFEIDSVFSVVSNSTAIIVDLRENCNFILHDITRLILQSKTSFYSVTRPSYKYPGLFSIEEGGLTGPKNDNTKYYKGMLIILIDEGTQSIGEFTVMALAKHPNSYIIGSPSSGANGNVSTAFLPGDIRTNFSGLGIYYPNFEQTQRIGIIPDIVALPTINGFCNNRDELLEAAISFANK
jgi:C-terminal processing protease CtpA/Prc